MSLLTLGPQTAKSATAAHDISSDNQLLFKRKSCCLKTGMSDSLRIETVME